MSSALLQLVPAKAAERKGKRKNTKRVESALTERAKADIKLACRVGRDVYYIAREHECAAYLVLQLDLRKLRAEVRDLRAMLFPPPAARKEAA